jgi:hypothetical protein
VKRAHLTGALCATAIACGYTVSANAATCVGGSFILFADTPELEACYDGATGGTGLWGIPTLFGDTILLSPNEFNAKSVDGGPTQITNSTIHMRLAAKDGHVFDGFDLTELGDYKLDGAGSEVQVDGQLRVFDPFTLTNLTDNIDTSGSDLTINDNNPHDWEGTASIEIIPAITFVNLTLQNILEARTTDGTSLAFIEKKIAATSITITTTPPLPEIPVPAAVWLFGSGLLGLIGLARRKTT